MEVKACVNIRNRSFKDGVERIAWKKIRQREQSRQEEKQMKEMKYQQVGDYKFPVLKQEESLPNLIKFERMYLKHLKENYKAHYLAQIAENKLNDELLLIDQQMNDRYNVLVKQLMEERNINEELKEKDQMKWVQEMNNIRNAVNEFLINEYIYVKQYKNSQIFASFYINKSNKIV